MQDPAANIPKIPTTRPLPITYRPLRVVHPNFALGDGLPHYDARGLRDFAEITDVSNVEVQLAGTKAPQADKEKGSDGDDDEEEENDEEQNEEEEEEPDTITNRPETNPDGQVVYKKFLLRYYRPAYRKKALKYRADQEKKKKKHTLQTRAKQISKAMVEGLKMVRTKCVEWNKKFWKMVRSPGATSAMLKRVKKAIVAELKHMGHSFADLGRNVATCAGIVTKLSRRETLVRSEKALLLRTAGDLFRIVPLIIILAVPFLEFALPILLKLFPNMLPSTFVDKEKEAEEHRVDFKARVELASFLQDTVGHMAFKHIDAKKETLDQLLTQETRDLLFERVQHQHVVEEFEKIFLKFLTQPKTSPESGEPAALPPLAAWGRRDISTSLYDALNKSETLHRQVHDLKKQVPSRLKAKYLAEETSEDDENFAPKPPSPLVDMLDAVLEQLRGEDEGIPAEDVKVLLKLYKDALSLDVMQQDQLVAMCQFMKVPHKGSPEMLRKKLEKKFKTLLEDDVAIVHEGIENLSIDDLRDACRDRAMRHIGLSQEQLQEQLQDWTQLSLHLRIPVNVLLFARAIDLADPEEELPPPPASTTATATTTTTTTATATATTTTAAPADVTKKTTTTKPADLESAVSGDVLDGFDQQLKQLQAERDAETQKQQKM